MSYKPVSKIKAAVAKRLRVGVSRVKIEPAVILQKVSSKFMFSNAAIREIIDKKEYILKPLKQRQYKIYRGLKKPANFVFDRDKFKSTHLKSLLKRKIITKKQIWIQHVRAGRLFLKQNRTKLKEPYRVLYRRLKGGAYLYNIKKLYANLNE